MSSVEIQITITITDLAHLDRVRALVADFQRPLPPAAPVSLDAVREAVTTAPIDATGPELSERIRIATGAPRFPREPDPVPVANAAVKKRRRKATGWTVTHEELDALPGHMAALTDLERETVRHRADGLTARAIAERMGKSAKTVEMTLRKVKEKLSLAEPYKPKRRGRPPGSGKVIPAPIVNEGSVWCRLCNANRTQHHVEQHQLENQREHDRQAAGRESIAHLPPDPGTRQTKASA